MKLFVALWLVMTTRATGAFLAGRACMRIRNRTKNRMLYEWFTAFGVGLYIWGTADFASVWNSVVNGPASKEAYPAKLLFYSLAFQLLATLGVWMVALVLLNGGVPGVVRRNVFRVLVKLHAMDYATPEEDSRNIESPE